MLVKISWVVRGLTFLVLILVVSGNYIHAQFFSEFNYHIFRVSQNNTVLNAGINLGMLYIFGYSLVLKNKIIPSIIEGMLLICITVLFSYFFLTAAIAIFRGYSPIVSHILHFGEKYSGSSIFFNEYVQLFIYVYFISFSIFRLSSTYRKLIFFVRVKHHDKP